MKIKNILYIIGLTFSAIGTCACSDSESYANLLKEEEKAVNWYLAQKTVCLEIPKDSIFLMGPDAPYYKMDEDGYLYMQVINPGDAEKKAEKGDKVYFRYMRMNIKNLYKNGTETWAGNAQNMEMAPASFWFDNYRLEDSQTYGQSIQVPLKYLGYNCEVNLVLKSYQGFTAEQAYCLPYAMNIRYFKAEY